jgi:hypothetical protein
MNDFIIKSGTVDLKQKMTQKLITTDADLNQIYHADLSLISNKKQL